MSKQNTNTVKSKGNKDNNKKKEEVKKEEYEEMNGSATFNYPNGDIYIGEFKQLTTGDKIREGKGKYIFPNGEIHEGNFVNGKLIGKGRIYKNGKNRDFGECTYQQLMTINAEITVGKWDFTLIAKKSDKEVLSGFISQYDIVAGNNTLSFTMQESATGTGEISVKVLMPKNSIAKTKFDLVDSTTGEIKNTQDEILKRKNYYKDANIAIFALIKDYKNEKGEEPAKQFIERLSNKDEVNYERRHSNEY